MKIYNVLGLSLTVPEEQAVIQARHILISFQYPSLLPRLMYAASGILDNGAFTIFVNGEGALDEVAYATWCYRGLEKYPNIDFVIIPDIIGGSAYENDMAIERWPKELRPFGVPVWHLDEPLDRLRRLSNEFDYIAIGGHENKKIKPGTKLWWRIIREALPVIRKLCRIHLLRGLSPAIYTRIPLASADSSGVAQRVMRNKKAGHATLRRCSKKTLAMVNMEYLESFMNPIIPIYPGDEESQEELHHGYVRDLFYTVKK